MPAANVPFEILKYLVVFRGLERLLLVGAGITAILCGARLFKLGVFDNFETAVEKGDWKVKVMSTAPGTVFGVAGLLLCGVGYLFGIRDVGVEFGEVPPAGQEKSAVAKGQAPPERPAVPPAPPFKMTLGAFSTEAVGLLDRYINELREDLPEDELKAEKVKQRRRDIASYVSAAYQDQIADLREMQKSTGTEGMRAALADQVARAAELKHYFDSAMSAGADGKTLVSGGETLATKLRSKNDEAQKK